MFIFIATWATVWRLEFLQRNATAFTIRMIIMAPDVGAFSAHRFWWYVGHLFTRTDDGVLRTLHTIECTVFFEYRIFG